MPARGASADADADADAPTPDEQHMDDGAIAGLAVGLLVLGCLLGLIIGRLSFKWSKTTTPKEVAPPQA